MSSASLEDLGFGLHVIHPLSPYFLTSTSVFSSYLPVKETEFPLGPRDAPPTPSRFSFLPQTRLRSALPRLDAGMKIP